MDWLPVMTLPDGTAIEIPVPSPEDTERFDDIHACRVRGPSGTTTFATLDEAADHVMHLPAQAWQDS